MILVFDNGIKFNGLEMPIGAAAAYLKKRVQKKIDNVYFTNMRNYEARLFELLKDVNRLLENPPNELNVKVIVSHETPLLEDFTKPRIEKLVRALNTMVNNNKLSKILEVLKNADEEFDLASSQQIDIAGISRKAIYDLEKFVNSKS